MTRRRLLFALVSLAACPGSFGLASTADAQPPATPRRIGVLMVEFALESEEAQAFRQGLRDAGYVEGRDVALEWRSTNGDYARLPKLAATLVQSKVDVIVVDSTPGAQAVTRATSEIPIVIALAGDLVGAGIVTNLAHPGGNVTGLTTMAAEQSAKRLQLLKETIPQLGRVAILWNPATLWHSIAIDDLKATARSLSIKLSLIDVSTPEELRPAFAAVKRAHAEAVYVLPSAQFAIHRRTLLTLASNARLPVIYAERRFADEGGLMSYGANYVDHWHRSAGYVDKILKGAKPGDVPIEQPTKFEMVVNLRTAKALGLTIPESILLRADAVIR